MLIIQDYGKRCPQDNSIDKIGMDRQYKRGLAEGWRKGIAEGKAQGSGQVNKLIKVLMSEKKYDELEKSAEDESYQKELMKKYEIIE